MKINLRTLVMMGLAASITAPVALRADEAADQDMKVKLQGIEEAIEGLNKKVDTLSGVFIEGFVDTRYDADSEPYVANGAQAGRSGFYNRRAEIKINGNVTDTSVYNLGFDFTELKLKDAGMEWRELPMIPFVDLPDYNWSLRVGQYRMPFGIYPQTSSSAIWFSDRPFLNGGGLNQDSGFPAAAKPVKLLAERVMGFQGRQKVKYSGIINYDLQSGFFNSGSDDQSAGVNKVQAGANADTTKPVSLGSNSDSFKSQVTDNNLSYVGRLALELDFIQVMLNNMNLKKNKFQIGGSYMHDPQNKQWNSIDPSKQVLVDTTGLEFLMELANKMLVIQSEYVHATTLTSTDSANLVTNVYSNIKGSAQVTEGWYAYTALDVMPIFYTPTNGESLQLLAGIEEQSALATDTGAFTHKISRLSSGLKWSYAGGKNHTSINYYVSAPDDMFGGDGRATADGGTGISTPETKLVIQQQFAFQNGTAK